jgi:hypothetical protein
MSCDKTSSAQNTQNSDRSLLSSIVGSVPLLRLVLDKNNVSSHPSPMNVSVPSSPFVSSPKSSSSLEYSDSEAPPPLECQFCNALDTENCCDGVRDENGVTTENWAKSYESTLDPRLDLFFKTVRGMTPEYLEELLERSWEVSPRDTLRTMFYVRDCRGGKGERKIFFDFMVWLWRHHREYFEKNLPCIPFYGCFKDLRKIVETGNSISQEKGWSLESDFEKMIVSYWCEVLGKDVEALNRNENITLAAKWVPIQNGKFCREMKLTHKLFRRMVRLLREKLDIVECKMSAGEWDKIYFERVCSLSMKKYSNAFRKHCDTRFSEYLESVKKGEKKMNVGQLYPSDIAGPYFGFASAEVNETMEVAWEQLLTKCRSTLCKSNKKFICVVDTSGSMNGKPLEVAVSLGLFLSELYPESRFYRNFITFSFQPTLQKVEGDTLRDRIRNLQTAEWAMNTNLQKVFDLLLDQSTPEDHPDTVLILSDMQFDQACENSQWGDSDLSTSTNLEEIERKYAEKGLTRPRLIFWNLRANTVDFPATTAGRDCGLVSGYSTSLMNALLEDGEISPMALYRNTIDNPRYDLVYTSFQN